MIPYYRYETIADVYPRPVFAEFILYNENTYYVFTVTTLSPQENSTVN